MNWSVKTQNIESRSFKWCSIDQNQSKYRHSFIVHELLLCSLRLFACTTVFHLSNNFDEIVEFERISRLFLSYIELYESEVNTTKLWWMMNLWVALIAFVRSISRYFQLHLIIEWPLARYLVWVNREQALNPCVLTRRSWSVWSVLPLLIFALIGYYDLYKCCKCFWNLHVSLFLMFALPFCLIFKHYCLIFWKFVRLISVFGSKNDQVRTFKIFTRDIFLTFMLCTFHLPLSNWIFNSLVCVGESIWNKFPSKILRKKV